MDVIEAILSRRSVRDFLAKPVPRETLTKIFEASLNSPSSGNGQPWEVFVATGKTMEIIRDVYQERFKSSSGGGGAPAPKPPHIQERMVIIRNERLKLLGLNPDDPKSGQVFLEWGARLFNVPAMAIICMDKALPSDLDIGLYIQTVCLAAQGYGVDTFIAKAFITHQDVLRKELEIPDGLNIITGIGLGYPAPDAIINTYRSPRRPVEEVVRFKD